MKLNIDGIPFAKGLITRSMIKHIQEELELSMQGKALLLFIWAIMKHP